MRKYHNLQDIFDDDSSGILDFKSKVFNDKTDDDRLRESFQEINTFYDQHNREPQYSLNNLNEHKLYARLQGIKDSEEKIEKLKEFDTHKILKKNKKEPSTIADILEDDALGVLDSENTDLFEIKNVPVNTREETDFVARRKVCKDFNKYETIFKTVQQDLTNGKRKLIDFNDAQLKAGNYFIHNGILLFLEKVTNLHKDKFSKNDGRTRIIFENGTESNMKLRSLGKNLLINGKTVTSTDGDITEDFQKGFSNVTNEDKEEGFIYVLKSNSIKEEISSISNLYKIGFSKNEVGIRISNAENDPTYLMSSVSIVKVYKCFNLNPQKLEMLLHKFFGNSCLDIDVYDDKGKRHIPREWFIAPIEVVDKAISLIISGDIVHYRYDSYLEEIITI